MAPAKRYPAVILGTCPIPWTDRFEFDADVFVRSVELLRHDLSPHLYLFGTAGEGYAVTDRQFAQIIRTFRAAMPAGTFPMVGVICLSLGTVIERIELARTEGFRDFQISLPAWGALTPAETDRFFAETCGRFPDCRFLHYNLMRTKVLLTGADYARLTAAHSNLVAIKMSGEDTAALKAVLTEAPALQCFLTEFGYAAMRDRHECGLLAALTAGNPRKSHEFHAARGVKLAQMRDELRQVHQAIKDAVAPCDVHIDGAYDKIFSKLNLPEFPLRLLPPYRFADDGAVERFRRALPPGWDPR